MSAENFIKIFRADFGGSKDAQNAYSAWSKSNRTWLNKNREELEDMGISRKVGFAMSESTADLLNVRAQFNQLSSDIAKNPKKRGPYLDNSTGTPIIIFPGVQFKNGIENTLDKFFGTGTSTKAKELKLVKGHVIGFATGALVGVKESLLGSKNISTIVSKEDLAAATKFLDVLIDHLTQMDIDSASIKNFSSKILAKYSKSSRHFLVELQLEKDNADSAKLVQKLAGRTSAASTGIRGLMNPGGHQKALIGKLATILKEQGLTGDEITDFKSSPSMKSLIVDDIVSILSDKPKKLNKTYSSNSIVVGEMVQLYVNEQDKTRYLSQLKSLKAGAVKHKAKVKKAQQQLASTSVVTTNLISLQNLINQNLAKQIQNNMGTGNSRRVLNYRTGRFASSATVERMSESRAGMITAFYSYMRNPYGTFAEGGAQEFPVSRNPKLLIAQSIRDLAGAQVANRMRAVLV